MNRNYNRDSNKGKMPAGIIIGIIFALLGLFKSIPQLIPIVIFVAIFLITINKRLKNNNTRSVTKEKINALKIKDKDIVVSEQQEINLENYKNKTETQKRLESLKSLYDNGFIDKDEYEEKIKKFM